MSLASEPTQSSSRRVSSFKDSSALLNNWVVKLFSSADESLKDETRLLLLWVGSLVTLQILVFTHITSVVKPVHIFMARSRVSKSRLKAELCFHLHRYVHFVFWYIYILMTAALVNVILREVIVQNLVVISIFHWSLSVPTYIKNVYYCCHSYQKYEYFIIFFLIEVQKIRIEETKRGEFRYK